MKKLATAIAAIALIGTPVFAADIGVPPAPAPAPVYNWTGWYVGVNAGVSLGTFKTDFNVAPSTSAQTIAGVAGTFSTTFPGFAGFDEVYPGGFIGGGQIGFNWQLSPIWVVGLEADFRVPTKKSTVLLPLLSVPPFLIRHNRVVLSALRTGLRPSITRQR